VLVGRRISFGRAAIYLAAQLLGAVAAALLLTLVSGGTVILSPHHIILRFDDQTS